MRTAVTSLLALLALAGAARAATEATREDLAFAYVEFEAAYASSPPPAEGLAEVNRTFDRVTMLFFSGRGGETIKGLAEMTASLRGETSPAGALARSVSVRVTPRVLVAGAKEPPVVAFDRFYEVPAPPEGVPPLAVVVVGRDGKRLATGLTPTGAVPLPAEVCALPPGLYEIRIGAPGDVEVARGRFAVVPRPLAEVRAGNDAALTALGALPPALKPSFDAVKARNALLTDAPSPAISAEFLADPAQLAQDVAAEIAALKEGRCPFTFPGSHWLALDVGGSVLPYRLTIPGLDPKSRGIGDPSFPIVVALHGAGGDENMFHWGYGAGLLEKLAEEKEFILVTPMTTRFSTRPEVFDALLDAVATMTPFADRGRVSLLGHSLGAMAAGIASRARKDKVAGVCLIAGLPPGGLKGLPPSKLYGGALDPLKGFGKAPPELTLLPNLGHTLVVTAVLPEAVDWLLAQRIAK